MCRDAGRGEGRHFDVWVFEGCGGGGGGSGGGGAVVGAGGWGSMRGRWRPGGLGG